jgi:hypothetical protein
VVRIRDDFKAFLAHLHVLRSRIEREGQQRIFVDFALLNREQSLLVKLPGDGAGFRHIAVILREEISQLGNGAIAVVARDFHQYAGSSGPIGFQSEFFIHQAGQFSRAALNGFFQRIARHVGLFGLQDGQPETRITVRVGA